MLAWDAYTENNFWNSSHMFIITQTLVCVFLLFGKPSITRITCSLNLKIQANKRVNVLGMNSAFLNHIMSIQTYIYICLNVLFYYKNYSFLLIVVRRLKQTKLCHRPTPRRSSFMSLYVPFKISSIQPLCWRYLLHPVLLSPLISHQHLTPAWRDPADPIHRRIFFPPTDSMELKPYTCNWSWLSCWSYNSRRSVSREFRFCLQAPPAPWMMGYDVPWSAFTLWFRFLGLFPFAGLVNVNSAEMSHLNIFRMSRES